MPDNNPEAYALNSDQQIAWSERKLDKHARKLARHAGRLAGYGFAESQRPAFACYGFLDIIKKKLILLEYNPIPNEVFKRANALLSDDGISIAHHIVTDADPYGAREQIMFIHRSISNDVESR